MLSALGRQRRQRSFGARYTWWTGHSHGYLPDAVTNLTADYSEVFYDQRGALFLPCRIEQFLLAKNVDDLDKLRREFSPSQPVRIVAHSAGNMLAMTFVERHPEAILTLSLLGSHAVRYPTEKEFESFGIPLIDASSERVQAKAQEQLEFEGLDSEITSARDVARKWRIQFAARILHTSRDGARLRVVVCTTTKRSTLLRQSPIHAIGISLPSCRNLTSL